MRSLLPKALRRALLKRTRWPPVGRVRLGDLRRLEPVSRAWGGDRGTPIDRHYIGAFLAENAADIRGRVVEVGNNRYTTSFGGDRVERSEVLDVVQSSPKVTILADLADAPEIPGDSFDCIVCTQTLQLIPDVEAAVATLHRILKPSGVALVTIPTVSQLAIDAEDRWWDHWRCTRRGARRLFEASFPPENVAVGAPGNVLTAVAFLHGLCAEELTAEELAFVDPQYELLVTVRAVKERSGGDAEPRASTSARS